MLQLTMKVRTGLLMSAACRMALTSSSRSSSFSMLKLEWFLKSVVRLKWKDMSVARMPAMISRRISCDQSNAHVFSTLVHHDAEAGVFFKVGGQAGVEGHVGGQEAGDDQSLDLLRAAEVECLASCCVQDSLLMPLHMVLAMPNACAASAQQGGNHCQVRSHAVAAHTAA